MAPLIRAGKSNPGLALRLTQSDMGHPIQPNPAIRTTQFQRQRVKPITDHLSRGGLGTKGHRPRRAEPGLPGTPEEMENFRHPGPIVVHAPELRQKGAVWRNQLDIRG